MKLSKKFKLAAIFTTAIALSTITFPIMANVTEEPIVEQQIIGVAVPAGAIGYNLAVVEQIPGKQQCWSESGSQPTIVDPLWTTFDFTGSCRRSTDSNGYSVRLDGQDTSLDYLLNIIPKGEGLQLIGQNRNDNSKVVIGQTFGKADGKYLKIYLNPGWKFTKKNIDGQSLGHYFFSGDTKAIAAAGNTVPTPPQPSASFTDIANDIYKKEIEESVALGFIAGYKDKTFLPTQSLTREQLVSMVYGALDTIDTVPVAVPAVPTQPYPDVQSSRWSAAKIQWAKENNIVKGYPDGSFRPANPVTRAELMAVLQNVAKFANTKQGKPAELVANKEVMTFSDTNGHWAAETIKSMSTYCSVASPYQETGTAFKPNQPAERNYAAAATLRTHHCLTGHNKAKGPNEMMGKPNEMMQKPNEMMQKPNEMMQEQKK
ncbi:S-layer domain protein [Chondrocystis sp. NIES-4102]|nr:S-layer domain protein [Chondrocystis sp. NIES-4102]